MGFRHVSRHGFQAWFSGMCSDMFLDMDFRHGVQAYVFRRVFRHVFRHGLQTWSSGMGLDMCLDMCSDMCLDICV